MNKFKILLLISIFGSVFAAEEDVRISDEMVQRLKNIIDNNKTGELRELLNNNAFNVDGIGLKFGIRINISEISGRSESRGGSYKFNPVLLKNGITPLIFAGIYAKPQIIHLLFQAGANPNKGVIIEDTKYYPLTIAYRGNFDAREEEDALVEITQEFISNPRTSLVQLKQALRFVNEVIAVYDSNSSFAPRLRELLEVAVPQSKRNQIISEWHSSGNNNNPQPYEEDANPPSYEEAMQQ